MYIVSIEEVKEQVNTHMKYALHLECGRIEFYYENVYEIILTILEEKKELELYSIWLQDSISYTPFYIKCTSLDMKEKLEEFFQSEKDCLCLHIIK